MRKPARPTFRIFETRASKEYMKIVADALSLSGSESATYPDLLTSSYPLPANGSRKGRSGKGGKAKRVINIDYIGVAASSLLDKGGKYTPNTHYDKVVKLLSSLDDLNGRGYVLRMRLLLQYPYSLAGQNRILADQWKYRSFMGDGPRSARDETKLARALTDKVIEGSTFVQNQQYCLQNLQDLLSSFDLKEPNRIEVRFASISTLICGLRVNNLFFYDPYHYGRLRGDNTCAMSSTPVFLIEGGNGNSGYEAFCNHFRYIWECDSTLDYDDVVERPAELSTIYIRKPEQLQTASKVERLRNSPAGEQNKVDWEARSRQFLQVIKSICPMVPPADDPEVGFLGASWEEKRDGSSDLCEPALMLEHLFKRGFEKVPELRVSVLRSEVGASLSSSLFSMMNSSTFSIIVLTRETPEGYCKPNVYIELGYLLHKNKWQRTYIVAEKGVAVPTNIADITPLYFEKETPHLLEEMRRIYKLLLQGMARNGVITSAELDLINRGDD